MYQVSFSSCLPNKKGRRTPDRRLLFRLIRLLGNGPPRSSSSKSYIETSTKLQHTRDVAMPMYTCILGKQNVEATCPKGKFEIFKFFVNSCNELNVFNFRLQDLYKSILLTDLESALDQKVEQDLWVFFHYCFKMILQKLGA